MTWSFGDDQAHRVRLAAGQGVHARRSTGFDETCNIRSLFGNADIAFIEQPLLVYPLPSMKPPPLATMFSILLV